MVDQWISLLLLVPINIVSYAVLQQLFIGRPWGDRPVSDGAFISIEAGLIGFVAWIHLIRCPIRDHAVGASAGVWDGAIIYNASGTGVWNCSWTTGNMP